MRTDSILFLSGTPVAYGGESSVFLQRVSISLAPWPMVSFGCCCSFNLNTLFLSRRNLLYTDFFDLLYVPCEYDAMHKKKRRSGLRWRSASPAARRTVWTTLAWTKTSSTRSPSRYIPLGNAVTAPPLHSPAFERLQFVPTRTNLVAC